jgi:hypothetical protein
MRGEDMNCYKHNILFKRRALSEVTIGKPLWHCDQCEEEEKEKIIRQFHVIRGSSLANRPIREVSKEFGVVLESLEFTAKDILEEGSAISVSGEIDKVHNFIEKIFDNQTTS